MNEKIPEGQVYVPRHEPTAPIRLADRNHAHLDVLEAIFIRTKSPALCQQKEHVRHL